MLEGSILDSAQQTAYLALGSRGLGIVNASQFQKPILLGQLDLPGDATDVAVDSNLRIAAVAANAGGLHLVNVAEPMQPALLHTINLNASQVEVIGGVAYVAADGDLWSFDLASRALLQQLPLGGATLIGLASEGLFLYTMDSSRLLRAIDLRDGAMSPRGSLALSSASGRLFVGNGISYVAAGDGQNGGFSTVDVSDPDNLRLISGVDAPNVQGQAVVANGSGLAVAVGTVRGLQGQSFNALDVLNVSDPANTAAFLTRFDLSAAPFNVAIGAGIAFVVDGTAGLQVVNYRSFDNLGVPPTITLSNSFVMTSPTNGLVEEGKLVLVSARTTDDVQVRNVEFYVDAVKVFSDASFPFEHRFITPRLTATKINFVVQAKATDTGGNFAWSDLILVALSPDATPPRVVRTLPGSGTIITQATDTVIAFFNEPIDVSTLNIASFRVFSAGSDNRPGTADDVAVARGVVSWRDSLNAALITFPAPLPFGIYSAVVTAVVADITGNHLTNDFSSTFAYLASGTDGDDDGDGLSNADELARGTNPFLKDTDGDGWEDALEVADGTDPLNPSSRPQTVYVARPPLTVVLPGTVEGLGSGVTVARPPVEIVLPGAVEGLGTGVTVARPPCGDRTARRRGRIDQRRLGRPASYYDSNQHQQFRLRNKRSKINEMKMTMKTTMHSRLLCAFLLSAASPLWAQLFSSGSDGSYGPLIVGTNTTLDMPPDGIFKCTTIVVSNGATLTFRRNALNAPVYLLATSNVTIDEVINISGAPGGNGVAGEGGPGGFDGGKPAHGPDSLPADGLGPGGGEGGSDLLSIQPGAFSSVGYNYNFNGAVGLPNTNLYSNSLLIPLIGGSGGGGNNGGGGSGGGGAILIASDIRVDVRGQIQARGGTSNDGNSRFGTGSGGAIRLVAPVIAGNGILDVFGGGSYMNFLGSAGGSGRIRVDATDRFSLSFTFNGPRKIGSYMQVFQNPIPRLDILEAAGQIIPEGTNAAVRVTLPLGTTTNQTVRVQARDFTGLVPINVVVTPNNGPSTKYPAQIDMSAGNPAEITVNVVIPVDTTCQIHAWTR